MKRMWEMETVRTGIEVKREIERLRERHTSADGEGEEQKWRERLKEGVRGI